jgi:trehalose synthase
VARRLFHISNTRYFGGIPEVIRAENAVLERLRIPQAWVTLRVDDEMHAIERHLNDCLHGVRPISALDQDSLFSRLALFGLYEAERLRPGISPGDSIILHDPLALSLAPYFRNLATRIMWRSHIGHNAFNSHVERGIALLEPFTEALDNVVFHRAEYVWPQLKHDQRVLIIPPGIDPTSPKNLPIDAALQRQLLSGLLTTGSADLADLANGRRWLDGESPSVTLQESGTGWLPTPNTSYLLQVARWDRHKGHAGVVSSFVQQVADALDMHLVLLGPRCQAGFSAPHNVALMSQILQLRSSAPPAVRDRIHIWSFGVAEKESESWCVNLLQRGAHTIIQKSTQEGFGLAVTEAMWKRKVVVASAVGGIKDQIQNGVNGVLSEDVEGGKRWSKDLIWACTSKAQRPLWAEAAHVAAKRYLVDSSVEKLLLALTEFNDL